MADLAAQSAAMLDALNRGDFDRFGDGVTDDIVYEEPGAGERFDGKPAYLERLRRVRRAFPDLTGTLETQTVSGDRLVLELTWRGTHTGPLIGPLGEVPATGRSVVTRTAVVIDYGPDGRARAVRNYTSPLLLLQQIGAFTPRAEAATS